MRNKLNICTFMQNRITWKKIYPFQANVTQNLSKIEVIFTTENFGIFGITYPPLGPQIPNEYRNYLVWRIDSPTHVGTKSLILRFFWKASLSGFWTNLNTYKPKVTQDGRNSNFWNFTQNIQIELTSWLWPESLSKFSPIEMDLIQVRRNDS